MRFQDLILILSTISDLRTEAQSANDFCPQNVICDTISFTRLSWLLYNDELTGYWKRTAKTDTENRKHIRPLISTWPVIIREVEMTRVSADLDAPFVLGSLWGFLQFVTSCITNGSSVRGKNIRTWTPAFVKIDRLSKPWNCVESGWTNKWWWCFCFCWPGQDDREEALDD